MNKTTQQAKKATQQRKQQRQRKRNQNNESLVIDFSYEAFEADIYELDDDTNLDTFSLQTE